MVKVLLTGATGSIGGAILKSLLLHGNHVNSIVRDQAKGEALAALSPNSTFTVLPIEAGTIEQIVQLAKEHDVFIHNVLQYGPEGTSIEINLSRGIVAAGRELEAAGKQFQFIYTSGCLCTGNTSELVDESYSGAPIPMVAWRKELDEEVASANGTLFVSTVVRPVWVYPGSYVDQWVASAKRDGKVSYLAGSEANYVSFTHLQDLGNLYSSIITHRAHGLINGTDSHPLTVRQIVDKVKEITGVAEEATFEEPFSQIPSQGFFVVGQSLNQQIATSRAQELGWELAFPSWLEAPHSV